MLACTFAAGCRHTTPPPVIVVDGGSPPDAGPGPGIDTDGDGLCDVTEFQRRTDSLNADSDGDGFSDYVEAQNASDPNDLGSPDRSMMVTVSEATGGMAVLPLAFVVRGVGETFVGEITSGLINIPDDGTTAFAFYAGSSATGAAPMQNVRGGIEGSQYLGVVGRTRLAYTLEFLQRQEPRGCMRAYPFTYRLITTDGSVRGLSTRWLVLLPPGMQIGGTGARWCGPTVSHCI